MKAKKTRNKKINISPWLLLLLLPVAILLFLYTKNYSKCIGSDVLFCIKSKKYESATGRFSFRYPGGYPLTFEAETGAVTHSPYDEIEWVNFSSEFYRNAGGDRLGSIVVERATVSNVQELGDKTMSDFNKAPARYRGIPPVISYVRVGGKDAVHITRAQQPSSFTPPSDRYVVIHKGEVYEISFYYNSTYHRLPEEYYQKGKDLILSTFTFN